MKALLLLFSVCLALATTAQTLDPSFVPPSNYYSSGEVYTVGPAQADGKRIIAGNFKSINGIATGSVARLDAAGNLDLAFAQNLGIAANVYRIKLLANGQYIFGSQGGDILAGNLTRTEVLRLNADGTGDASFDAGTGPSIGGSAGYTIDYTAQPDGKLLVGGYFNGYSGVAAGGLVRLTTTGSIDPSFSVGSGVGAMASGARYVAAIAVQANGKILAGGSFTQFNGQAANGLVRLNPDGSLDTSFINPLPASSYVTGLVMQPDGSILVSGSFGTSSSSARLIRLLASGSQDMSFSLPAVLQGLNTAGFADPPLAVQPDGKIILIGDFYGASLSHLARVNANGSQDLSFQPTVEPTKSPKSVGVQPDGSVMLGVFYSANLFGSNETTLAKYSATGTYSSLPTRVQLPASVSAVARQADGSLLVGGLFTEWNGQAVHHLVHLSSSGTLDASFSGRLGTVAAPIKNLLLQPDGKIVANTASGPVRLAANGSPDTSFSAQSNVSYYTAMALQADGKLLISGFPSGPINGVFYYGLLRLTSTGALDPSFVRATSSFGSARQADAIVVQPDGRIVVASDYYLTGGGTGHYVLRYQSTGLLDATFTPQSFTGVGTSAHLYALALQADGKLLVGGNFTQAGSVPQPSVARLTSTGQPDNTFAGNHQLIGSVYALAIQPNRRVLLGGNFSAFTATNSVTNLGRLLETGQLDGSFVNTTTPDGTVAGLVVQPDGAIVLGGSFATIYGQPALGIARISATNVLAVSAPAAVAARTQVWPVPAHGLLHVAPDLSAQPLGAELLDALGRTVRQQPLTNAAEFTLPLEGLPTGVYLLRVQYAAGAVTRRLAVE